MKFAKEILILTFICLSGTLFSQLNSNDVTVTFGEIESFPMDTSIQMSHIIVELDSIDIEIVSEVTIEVKTDNHNSQVLAIIHMKSSEFTPQNFVDNKLSVDVGVADSSIPYKVYVYTKSFQGAQSNIIEKNL